MRASTRVSVCVSMSYVSSVHVCHGHRRPDVTLISERRTNTSPVRFVIMNVSEAH